jgi:aryl-alcohol dehydrogenase-like predicted oxidoreductase
MGTWKGLDVKGPELEAERHRVVRTALDAGIRVFDSSPMYGESERVLADGLGPRRKDAFVATKVWAKAEGESERQIANALRYYGGRVDLYQVHNLSRVEEVLPRLRQLKETGAVGRVGLTHWDPSSFDLLASWMQRGEVDSVQLPYNALEREAEERLLPLAEELGLGVLVMVPLGSGQLLSRPLPPSLQRRCRDKGATTLAQALLKWVLSDPRVHVALPATSRPERAVENAQAGSPPWFDEEDREAISEFLRRPT